MGPFVYTIGSMRDLLMQRVNMCPAPGSPEAERMAPKKQDYMALVGSFLWLANVTYFHISYAASQLARFVSNPGDPRVCDVNVWGLWRLGLSFEGQLSFPIKQL